MLEDKQKHSYEFRYVILYVRNNRQPLMHVPVCFLIPTVTKTEGIISRSHISISGEYLIQLLKNVMGNLLHKQKLPVRMKIVL